MSELTEMETLVRIANEAKRETERCPNCGKLCWAGECRHSGTRTGPGFASTLYGVCRRCAEAHDNTSERSVYE